MKKVFLLFLILVMVLPVASVSAAPEIESRAAILMDAQTGQILYSKNQDEVLYPASITKIMTALVTLDHCELNEEVTYSLI